MKKITVAGSLVLDITPVAETGCSLDFCGGSQTYLKRIAVNPGGCVGNTGVALHKLGFPVHLISKIGEDDFGMIASRVIGRLGCHNSLITDRTEATSCSIILLPRDNNRVILHKRGASHMIRREEILSFMPSDTSVLHLGYPPNLPILWIDVAKELLKLLKEMKNRGIVTSIDMCAIKIHGDYGIKEQRKALESVLPYCDIFLPSMEDISPLYSDTPLNKDEIQSVSEYFISSGVAIVLIKDGKHGMYLRTGSSERLSKLHSIFKSHKEIDNWSEKSMWRNAAEVSEIVSTTGAGDIAVAGFLSSLLFDKVLSPDKSMDFATALAGISLKSQDATSLIPSYEEVLKIIE